MDVRFGSGCDFPAAPSVETASTSGRGQLETFARAFAPTSERRLIPDFGRLDIDSSRCVADRSSHSSLRRLAEIALSRRLVFALTLEKNCGIIAHLIEGIKRGRPNGVD